MTNFYEQFELENMLSYLKSAEYIESQLIAHYEEPSFYRNEYRSYKKRLPLLVRELYTLIVELKDLPSAKEFEDRYVRKHRIKEADYFSETTAVRKAYTSLVRDLHFYYLLKESNKFQDVEMRYRFDLAAQTDILIKLNEKRLGIQLFAGGNTIKEEKQKHYKKFKGENNYELLYLGTGSKGERKHLNTSSGSVFTLYSDSDVDLVLAALMGSEEVLPSLNDENFEGFDQFTESIPLKIPIISKNYSAKHSILEIGRISETDAKKRKVELERKGIVYYYCDLNIASNINIYDGKGFSDIEELLADIDTKDFNIKQYKIEHELASADIAVMAGAGSGKTYTLVSRTIYLLNMGYIQHVHDIAMITFTNDAADNILQKLSERFVEMYEKTKDNRFMRYLEELREMKIMTIPAFAKFVLKEYGHHIGLGQSMKISALTMKKRELIEKKLNEVNMSKNFNEEMFKGLQYYQIRDFVSEFADKLEQKGVFSENIISKISHDNKFEQLIVNTIAGVESDLNDYKQEHDILGLSDLNRYLKRLIDSAPSMESLNKKFRYLFIDEFQDTDSLQIEFLVNLSVNAKIPLLVVGDIKQGIYRFRGANVSAFEIIFKRLTEANREIKNHDLVKNYRTAEDLLVKIEDIFSGWRRLGHLTNDKPMVPTCPKSLAKECFKEYKQSINPQDIFSLYEDMAHRTKDEEISNRVLCILVRTNREVAQINELLTKQCRDLDIPIQVIKEGSLFKSSAAKDLKSLIYSLLNPENPIALYELSQTLFCKSDSLPEIIFKEGYYDMDNLTFDIPVTWDLAIKQLKLAPANIVLNEFLSNTPLIEQEDEQFKMQYILNLHKIMTLMDNSLQSEYVDLYTLYKWLDVEVATNNREDEAELVDSDFSKNYIKVMTVHKSKGLEFDTVVLPYIHETFVKKKPRMIEILVETDELEVEYAWHFETNKNFSDTTQKFAEMTTKEQPQLLMEETRNLYVALTRAEQCIAVFDMKKSVYDYEAKAPNTWHHLIKGGRYK